MDAGAVEHRQDRSLSSQQVAQECNIASDVTNAALSPRRFQDAIQPSPYSIAPVAADRNPALDFGRESSPNDVEYPLNTVVLFARASLKVGYRQGFRRVAEGARMERE